MVRKVIHSDRSLDDLRRICDRVAEDNPQASRKLGRDLLAAASRLGQFPKMGHFYALLKKGELYELACRGYRIFYALAAEDAPVEIRHIRHGARDEPDFGE